jgi:hypothetical protein
MGETNWKYKKTKSSRISLGKLQAGGGEVDGNLVHINIP